MSKKLCKESMLSVLPSALSLDKNLFALASAAADELEELCSCNDSLEIYPNISSLSEKLLDILAYDYKVDWYFFEGSLESKRAQIKSSFYVHRHLGTKSALIFALTDTFPGTYIEEWFEYGGRPGYFRIRSDNPAITSDVISLLDLIRKVKRASARLESIQLGLETDGNVIFGIATEMAGCIDIWPKAARSVTSSGETCVSAALQCRSDMNIYPYGIAHEIDTASEAIASGALSCKGAIEIFPTANT